MKMKTGTYLHEENRLESEPPGELQSVPLLRAERSGHCMEIVPLIKQD